MSYSYGATGSGPHQARNVGGQASTYDANGNLMSGGGRTYSWTADNQPATITSGSVQETYDYDADSARVKRTRSGVTTVYLGMLYEVDQATGASNSSYTFNGQMVAMRGRNAQGTSVTYLHGDHLGSISVATSATGTVLSKQEYTPWGSVRSGNIPQTTLDYTGQRRDDTGLVFLNARYYDPVLGRFVSADSIVPEASGGKTNLTVDFHDVGFVGQLNGHNAFTQDNGFAFQLSGEEREQAEGMDGPSNPQALNRYSYTLNNPVLYVDPTGHLPDPNGREIATCLAIVGLGACLAGALLLDHAEELAQDLFPGKDALSVQLRNSFFHAYGAALLAKHLTPWLARFLLNAHEGGSRSEVLTPELLENNQRSYWDHAQDFWNNDVGVAIGTTMMFSTDQAIAAAVLQSLQEGKLRVRDWRQGSQGLVASDVAYWNWRNRRR